MLNLIQKASLKKILTLHGQFTEKLSLKEHAYHLTGKNSNNSGWLLAALHNLAAKYNLQFTYTNQVVTMSKPLQPTIVIKLAYAPKPITSPVNNYPMVEFSETYKRLSMSLLELSV